jgi:hypothetical protein
MEGGTQQHWTAGLGKSKPRTMRRQTVPGLGEELADRTQQRIVRIAARDWCHRGDDRRTARSVAASLEGPGGGQCCRISGYLPAMRHHQDELSHDDEQAKEGLYAARYGTARRPGSVTLCSIPTMLGDQRGFPLSQCV